MCRLPELSGTREAILTALDPLEVKSLGEMGQGAV